MSVIHLRQIGAHLESLFDGLVDLSDVRQEDEARTNAFLTRALAAFALTHLGELEPETAARAITDGYQDNGLDAVHYSQQERILYLVQAKWYKDGKGSISKADMQKFLTGFKDLVNLRFDRFNEKVTRRREAVLSALNDAQTRILLAVIYTGQQPLADEVRRDLDDVLVEMNDPVEVVKRRVLRQGDIYSSVTHGTKGAPINEDVVLRHWGQQTEPYFAVYGQISADDIALWWEHHYPRIFAPNIRVFLGDTDVNESIAGTLRNNPEHFWYFNNGVTALCGSVQKKPVGGSGRENGIFECKDLQIVNGAQTAGAIADAKDKYPDQVSKAMVPIKIISLEQCPEDFDREVTRYNNTQNRIERRDFVALDPEQERLKNELRLEDIAYAYKSGEGGSGGTHSFGLVEATVAQAVSQREVTYAVLAKREIGRLWDDIHASPYRALFNRSVDGIELWRKVQMTRAIDRQLEVERDRRTGRDHLLAVHGNRFIAHLVIRDMQEGMGSLPTNLPAGLTQAIEGSTEEIFGAVSELLDRMFPDAYLGSLFKNQTKCQQVKESFLLGGHEAQEELPLSGGVDD